MIQEIFNLQNPWRSGMDYSFDLMDREIFSNVRLGFCMHQKNSEKSEFFT